MTVYIQIQGSNIVHTTSKCHYLNRMSPDRPIKMRIEKNHRKNDERVCDQCQRLAELEKRK